MYSIAPAPQPAVPDSNACADLQATCSKWAADGECGRNPAFMHRECPRSCARCSVSALPGAVAGRQAAAPSAGCSTAGTVAGSMRCVLQEHYTETITVLNHTRTIFNNETNATETEFILSNKTSSVYEGSTVRMASSIYTTQHDSPKLNGLV